MIFHLPILSNFNVPCSDLGVFSSKSPSKTNMLDFLPQEISFSPLTSIETTNWLGTTSRHSSSFPHRHSQNLKHMPSFKSTKTLQFDFESNLQFCNIFSRVFCCCAVAGSWGGAKRQRITRDPNPSFKRKIPTLW